MAYIINKYNGDQAALVSDGTINTTLDLKLIGKNYAGYGEAQNENYVWLLENFANQSAPPNAIVGQLWYQTSTQKLKVNYGTGTWHTVGVTDVVATLTDATGLTQGDLFWVTDNQQLWCKGETDNVLIGGRLTGIITQMKTSTVSSNDVPAVSYEIIEAVIHGVTTFIISGHATEFTLAPAETLSASGWTKIKPGITVKGFNPTTNTSSLDYKLWGSSSDSDRLGGTLASGYVTKSGGTFSDLAKFSSSGFSLGTADSQILFISNESSIPTIKNAVTDTIQFRTTSSSVLKSPMKLVGQDIMPGNPNVNGSNIGSVGEKFNTIYALSVESNASSASALKLNTTVYAADTAATVQTAVLRTNADSTITFNGSNYTLPGGSIKAVQVVANAFVGNATSATGLTLLTDTLVPTIAATSNTIPARSKNDEVITFNGSNYTLPAGSIKAVQVQANVFVGNATSATGLVLNSATILPTVAATANTVVARSAASETVSVNGSNHTLPAGSIKVVEMYATGGVGSIYADLAEKYVADDTYEVGTVMMIGGEEEVTAAVSGHRALGVVSENPSFLMNIALANGTTIGLKGRVPVKVVGTVNKGDRLIASSTPGHATALTSSAESEYVFAIALSTSENNVVEAVIL